MPCCRADQNNKYEKYYNITFIWDVAFESKIRELVVQLIDSFFRYCLRTSRILQISLSVKEGYIGIEIVLFQAVSVFGNSLI